MATVFRNGKDAHNNGNDTSKGPEDGKGLRLVSNTFTNGLEEISRRATEAICSQRHKQRCTRV